jgi:hypothetical protein
MSKKDVVKKDVWVVGDFAPTGPEHFKFVDYKDINVERADIHRMQYRKNPNGANILVILSDGSSYNVDNKLIEECVFETESNARRKLSKMLKKNAKKRLKFYAMKL